MKVVLIVGKKSNERIDTPMEDPVNFLPRKGNGIVLDNIGYEIKEVIFDFDEDEIRLLT